MALLVNSKFHALPQRYGGEWIRLGGVKPGSVTVDVMLLEGETPTPSAVMLDHVSVCYDLSRLQCCRTSDMN